MLDSIEIRNFKAIQDEPDGTPKPLKLENLAQVNYLVGPNGCGKSSVLEGIALSNKIKEKDFNLTEHFTIKKNINKSTLPFLSIPVKIANKTTVLNKIRNKCFLELTYSPQNNKVRIFFFKKKNWYFKITKNNKIYKSTRSVLFSSSNQYDFEYKLHGELNEIYHYNNLYWLNNIENEDFDYHQYCEDYGEPKKIDISAIKSRLVFYIKKFEREGDKFSDGIFFLKKFVYDLYFYSLYGFDQFLIDEPENTIHPKIQKMLPELFNEISSIFKIQFLISTHSPFIISAAAKEENQKVYLIEGGQCAKPEGYIGYEMKEIANEMLGAKTTDVLFEHYILCEGTTDVEILNYIFQPYKNVKFILADNKDEVNKKIAVGLILNKISDEIKISGFVDWDGDDEKAKKFKENWEEKFGLKISDTRPKQKLESFLYDKSVLEILKKDFPNIDINREIDDKINTNLNVNFKSQKHTGHYENWFNSEYKNLGYDEFTNLNKKDFQLNKLAQIIREMGKDQENPNIYHQLHTLIFT